ncbi:hypothetical protein ACS0TY_001759 [Phlomoides rotata]
MSGLDFDPDCPLTNYMNSLKVVVLRVEVLLREHKFLLGWMESLLRNGKHSQFRHFLSHSCDFNHIPSQVIQRPRKKTSPNTTRF